MAIVVSKGDWNDFRYRVRFEFGFRSREGKELWLPGYFAIQGELDTGAYLKKEMDDRQFLPLDEIRKPFVSLQFELKNYSLLRRALGAERSIELLRKLHDLSVLGTGTKSIPDWPDISGAEVFNLAFIRASESYFSFRRGSNVLRGASTSNEDARQRILVDLREAGAKVSFDFPFERNSRLRGRIAVLVGKNGSGKTFSLSLLASGMVGANDLVRFKSRPAVNQVLAFVHRSSAPLFKRQRNKEISAQVRIFPLGPGVSNGFTVRDQSTVALIDIAKGSSKDLPLIEILQEVLRVEFEGLKLFVPVNEDSFDPGSTVHGYIVLEEWARGSEASVLSALAQVDHSRPLRFADFSGRIAHLSAGQVSFLRFLLNVLSNAGTASVLFIDEPENYLHPNLISKFLRVLNQLLNATNSIAFLATHSPFVVREVQSANVHVLTRSVDGEILVRHPRMQTLGANVASVSDEVFGDDLPLHLFDDLVKSANLEGMTFDEVLQDYSSELSPGVLVNLRRRLEKKHEGA